MQNVEFKAELRDIELVRTHCRALGARHAGTFEQVDTYYRMPDGRLKRRDTRGERVQWIYYHRADRIQPTLSNYSILTDRQARTRWGIASLKQWVTVRKVRELWTLENIRIHIDDVAGLGRFLEFEAIVTNDCDVETCRAQMAELRTRFAHAIGEPIATGYADLIANESELSSTDS